MMCNVFVGRKISITTFREGDKADTGQHTAYKCLGFAESEFLTEFGHPTQRLILPSKREKGDNEQIHLRPKMEAQDRSCASIFPPS